MATLPTRVRSLEIEELSVKRLRVGELFVTEALVTPTDGGGKAQPSGTASPPED